MLDVSVQLRQAKLLLCNVCVRNITSHHIVAVTFTKKALVKIPQLFPIEVQQSHRHQDKVKKLQLALETETNIFWFVMTQAFQGNKDNF